MVQSHGGSWMQTGSHCALSHRAAYHKGNDSILSCVGRFGAVLVCWGSIGVWVAVGNPLAMVMDLEGTAAGSKSTMVFGSCWVIPT